MDRIEYDFEPANSDRLEGILPDPACCLVQDEKETSDRAPLEYSDRFEYSVSTENSVKMEYSESARLNKERREKDRRGGCC